VLVNTASNESLSQATALSTALAKSGVQTVIIGDFLSSVVNQTFSVADATVVDGVIVTTGTESLFGSNSSTTLFPAARPQQIVSDAYRWGKPVGTLGSSTTVLKTLSIPAGSGVFTESTVSAMVSDFEEGLKTFRFTDRFAVEL